MSVGCIERPTDMLHEIADGMMHLYTPATARWYGRVAVDCGWTDD